MLIRNKSVLIYLLFFFSGFSALIYEVVWLRKLELVFGTTTYAVSTVIAVFFSGLAIGSYVFGQIIERDNFQFSIFNFQSNSNLKFNKNFKFQISNLQLYGLLELSIGFYALLTPWIFIGIEQAQALVWQEFAPGFGGFSVVTFFLATLGLILPTILMGGTFPVVAKATNANRMRMPMVRMNANELIKKHSLISDNSLKISSDSRVVGWLYGLNTLGAVVGTLLAGFWLIASIGVNQTIWVAAGISLIVGETAVIYANKNANKNSGNESE